MTSSSVYLRRLVKLAGLVSILLSALFAAGAWLSWAYMAGSWRLTTIVILSVMALTPVAQVVLLKRAIELEESDYGRAVKLHLVVIALTAASLVAPQLLLRQ